MFQKRNAQKKTDVQTGSGNSTLKLDIDGKR